MIIKLFGQGTQSVPTSFDKPALSTERKKTGVELLEKMNKERFHNALALALGYDQIVNVKRYNIIVDEKADEPKILIKNADGIILKFKVSEIEGMKKKGIHLSNDFGIDKEIKMLVDAVHRAYKEATTQPF